MPVQPLSELKEWQLVDTDQDLTGKKLVDQTGRDLGTIKEMIVSTENERVESVATNQGDLYLVGAIEIADNHAIFHGVKATAPTANLEPLRIRRRLI
jgi:sporulation protein YlmC with PRC-barrel domain